jgi:hypothetical protein
MIPDDGQLGLKHVVKKKAEGKNKNSYIVDRTVLLCVKSYSNATGCLNTILQKEVQWIYWLHISIDWLHFPFQFSSHSVHMNVDSKLEGSTLFLLKPRKSHKRVTYVMLILASHFHTLTN